MSTLKQNCSVEGCNLELENVSPHPQVEALSTLAQGCVRTPKAVARIYDGTCPLHGRVAVSRPGHHIDPKKKGEDAAVIFIKPYFRRLSHSTDSISIYPRGSDARTQNDRGLAGGYFPNALLVTYGTSAKGMRAAPRLSRDWLRRTNSRPVK